MIKNILIIIVVVGIALWLTVFRKHTPTITGHPSASSPTAATSTATSTPDLGRAMSVEEFVKANIGDLSHASGTVEILGGKFYVTQIETHGGVGTVWYEDGHIEEVADFTYAVDERGAITLKSFKVRN